MKNLLALVFALSLAISSVGHAGELVRVNYPLSGDPVICDTPQHAVLAQELVQLPQYQNQREVVAEINKEANVKVCRNLPEMVASLDLERVGAILIDGSIYTIYKVHRLQELYEIDSNHIVKDHLSIANPISGFMLIIDRTQRS